MSLPCLFFCVGSCSSKKNLIKSVKEIQFLSYVTSTTSAKLSGLNLFLNFVISEYFGSRPIPSAYPDSTFITPGNSANFFSTLQKHPAPKTILSSWMVIFFEEKVVDAKIAIKNSKGLKRFGKQTIRKKKRFILALL